MDVLPANRWRRKALAAGTLKHADGNNLFPLASCRITSRSGITSSIGMGQLATQAALQSSVSSLGVYCEVQWVLSR
jgi:hypothetical protein